MPLPKPRPNEQREDFISRCMNDLNTEFPDNKQRAAVCNTQWNEERKMKDNDEYEIVEFKVDVAALKDVEILDAGTWIDASGKRVTIKESDLDEMIGNFKNKIREPILNLDHNKSFTEKVKKALKVVGLGFISNLRRNGSKLIADFKEVPVKLAELIKAGSLKKRSAEFFIKGYQANGKVYNNVLSAVSFFGHDAPAINSLNNDFEVVFDALMQMDDHKIIEDNQEKTKILYKEAIKMDKVELSKDEYQELLKQKAANEDLSVKFKVISDELDKMKSDLKGAKEKEDELTNLKADIEKDKQATLKKEAESFVDGAIKDNKIMAKFKDHYVSQYVDFSTDEDKLSMFKEEINSRSIEPKKELELGRDDIDTSKVDLENDDKLNELIEINMKKNGTGWIEEATKLGLNVANNIAPVIVEV
jgi:hypothetical protein